MKIGRILFLLVSLSAALAAPAQAQPGAPAPRQTPTPAPSPQDDGRTEVITTREVRVPVTVVDKKGVPVTGLAKSDFQVFEDKAAQQFEFVGELKELQKLPVYVAVLMDTSSSTAGKLKFEQEAALNFLHTVTRLRKDRAAFVTFDDEVRLRQDFTSDLDKLSAAVNAVKKPGTQTALYDAVWQFCNEKMRDIGGGGRRVLVLITDGDDTYSRATLREAIEIAQQTDTIIFSLSTKGGFIGSAVPGVEAGTVKDTGDKNLERLAEETGGRAFFTGDMLALERAFKRIGEELRAQYILSYRPSRAFDGSRREIEVKLTNKGDGWKVRAKRGYRADKDLVSQ